MIGMCITIKRGMSDCKYLYACSLALNPLAISHEGVQCNSHQMETNEAAVEMKRCAAYEVTPFYQQKVVMKGNPSYEPHVVRANV